MGPKSLLVVAAFACATAACAARPAWAGLGGHATGATGSDLATPAGAPYRQQVTQLDSGTTVREFIDARGTVFAVSWSGPFLPDLRELLGEHFADLRQSELGGKGRSGSVSISRPDLMLVSAGHMGAFQGRAWLPGQLPAGFDPRTLP